MKKSKKPLLFGNIEKNANMKHKEIFDIEIRINDDKKAQYKLVTLWPLFQMGLKDKEGNIFYLDWEDVVLLSRVAGFNDE